MKKIFFLLLLLVWTAALFVFSGQSAADSGELSSNLTLWLMERLPFIKMELPVLDHIIRKLAHLCFFALEGFLMYWVLRLFTGRSRASALWACVICALLAGANELHQLTASGRSCEFTDVLIDSAGALCGIALGAFTGWLLHKLDRRRRV